MYEASKSKGGVMGMWAAIAGLLILAIVLSLKLRAVPEKPDDVAFRQRLDDEKTTIVTIIDDKGKVVLFDRNLSLLKACDEESQDTTITDSCRPQERSALVATNNLEILSFRNQQTGDELVAREGEATYLIRRRCPDGTAPAPNPPYC